MAQTLDEFMAEARAGLESFEADYRAKHEALPEHYPLSMPDGNDGLWFEFLMDHMASQP